MAQLAIGAYDFGYEGYEGYEEHEPNIDYMGLGNEGWKSPQLGIE